MTRFLLVMAVAAVSCTPSDDAPASASPSGGSQLATSDAPRPQPLLPQVVLPDGFEVTLELAITPDELAQGLMFRPSLSENRGMLLIFSEERLPSIWMMNTLVALDLIYLDRNGVVVDVVTDAQPCPSEPCPRFVPKAPAQAVLEIPAGGANRHGVVDGERLTFERVPGYPLSE
jgi:uncharacterized membrane protein (UPF0127 family)